MSKRRAERHLAVAAPIFAALGDETRLAILQRLARDGPASISALAEGCGAMSRQGVTKHLQVLESAGVIGGHREGRQHVWALNAGALEDARRSLDVLGRGWDDALARLKAHAERDPG
jgi:DNA-binding transcriptional ArsR family regulator